MKLGVTLPGGEVLEAGPDTPLLRLSGCVDTENWGLGAIQEMSQSEMVRPASKWSRSACRR